MGRSLIGQLFTQNGIAKFTPATSAQFTLSEQIGDQIRKKGIGAIKNAMDYCLKRKAEWVKVAKSALVPAKYEIASSDTAIAVARRKAFDAAASNDFVSAVTAIQEIVNAEGDSHVKGWLMAELAEYTHFVNAVEAQQIQSAAHELNGQLIRPHAGINYQRLSPHAGTQAKESLAYIQKGFTRTNELLVATNAIVNDLIFCEDSFRKFQRALRDVAYLLGFGAQLPESEFGAGPDVLWAVGGLKYFVIECKNEATTATINKKDTNQLAGSVNWFAERYDATCSATPIMVHPSAVFERAATPPPGTRIMTKEKLPLFRDAVTSFCIAVAGRTTFGDVKSISGLLTSYGLLSEAMVEKYTVGAITPLRVAWQHF